MKIVSIDSNTFLFVEGKVINLKYIVSVVPSYKQTTTMIYISTSDKAIALASVSAEEVMDFLIDCEDYNNE